VLLWKPMQQNDHRPVGRAGINDFEHELAATELFHRLTVSVGHGAGPPSIVTLIGDD
jgi:hypothetical protein